MFYLQSLTPYDRVLTVVFVPLGWWLVCCLFRREFPPLSQFHTFAALILSLIGVMCLCVYMYGAV